MVTPFFCIWISQQKSPEKGICNFNDPTLPPSQKTSPGETWTQPLVISWLISSESPQARFTDHNKYDFSLIAPTSNYKVISFHLRLACDCEFHTPPHHASKAHSIFNSLQKIQEDYPSLRPHKKILNPPCLFVPLINIRVRCKFIFSPPRKGSWTTGFWNLIC